MIINEGIVKSGISRMLYQYYGKEYDIIKETMPQGFENKTFTIQRILSTRKKGLMDRYYQTYNFVISYYTEDDFKGEIKAELDEKLEELYLLFKYIEIKDNEGNTALLQVSEINGEVVDDILRVNLTTKARIGIVEDKDKIRNLKIYEKIKEEI